MEFVDTILKWGLSPDALAVIAIVIVMFKFFEKIVGSLVNKFEAVINNITERFTHTTEKLEIAIKDLENTIKENKNEIKR